MLYPSLFRFVFLLLSFYPICTFSSRMTSVRYGGGDDRCLHLPRFLFTFYLFWFFVLFCFFTFFDGSSLSSSSSFLFSFAAFVFSWPPLSFYPVVVSTCQLCTLAVCLSRSADSVRWLSRIVGRLCLLVVSVPRHSFVARTCPSGPLSVRPALGRLSVRRLSLSLLSAEWPSLDHVSVVLSAAVSTTRLGQASRPAGPRPLLFGRLPLGYRRSAGCHSLGRPSANAWPTVSPSVDHRYVVRLLSDRHSATVSHSGYSTVVCSAAVRRRCSAATIHHHLHHFANCIISFIGITITILITSTTININILIIVLIYFLYFYLHSLQH